jgi:hypothetical protein
MEKMSAVRDPSPNVCIRELANHLSLLAFYIEQLYEGLERLEQKGP